MGITVTQRPALNSYANDFSRVKAISYGSYIKFQNEKRVFRVPAVGDASRLGSVKVATGRGVKCAQLIRFQFKIDFRGNSDNLSRTNECRFSYE